MTAGEIAGTVVSCVLVVVVAAAIIAIVMLRRRIAKLEKEIHNMRKSIVVFYKLKIANASI